MQSAERQAIVELILRGRWAALAVCGADGPIAAQVAYAPAPTLDDAVMLLSQLAAHTRALLERPQAVLSISEPDDGRRDPQTLRRIGLRGSAAVIERSAPEFAPLAARYLARFPDAERLFQFGDFLLWRLSIEQARYVGGFGAARTLSGAALRALAGPA